MKIQIPEYVNQVLAALARAGWEGYIVGGCVRDICLSRIPSDWDVCTPARPQQIKEALKDFRTIDTGIQHGTVTALSDGKPVEITACRVDGNYSDGRHPDSVTFTDDVTEDLARRDFTINAMAYSEARGLVDPFGGRADLAAGIIRCVGDPAQRFTEDALRIMRALRFASVLGFAIEEETERAVRELAGTVRRVATERIQVELSKLLTGSYVNRILTAYRETISACIGQNLPAVTDLERLPDALPVRLAALQPLDLKALKYDNKTIALAYGIAEAAASMQDAEPGRRELLLLLRDLGQDAVRGGLALRGYDDRLLSEILESGACYSLRQLAVSGRDLTGLSGPEIGETLQALLLAVILGLVPNEREPLLSYVKTIRNGDSVI